MEVAPTLQVNVAPVALPPTPQTAASSRGIWMTALLTAVPVTLIALPSLPSSYCPVMEEPAWVKMSFSGYGGGARGPQLFDIPRDTVPNQLPVAFPVAVPPPPPPPPPPPVLPAPPPEAVEDFPDLLQPSNPATTSIPTKKIANPNPEALAIHRRISPLPKVVKLCKRNPEESKVDFERARARG